MKRKLNGIFNLFFSILIIFIALRFSSLKKVKKHLKCTDEITKENLDNNINSAIIKSVSTPASLQAVVRFQNGSNGSLQHKVS